MKNYRRIRFSAAVVTAFIALTATGGGLAILTGVESFPLEWLRGTPFTSYTIPALLLTIGAGGTSLFASLSLFNERPIGIPATIVAGIIMIGYIITEALLLNQIPPAPTTMEIFYFLTGMLTLILGLALHRKKELYGN